MIDTAIENTELKVRELDEIMKRIKRHSNPDDDSAGGITPIKDATQQSSENTEAQAAYAANVIYDGMMLTLSEIGLYAGKKAKGVGILAREYETVVRTIEPLAHICRALADDRVPITKNTDVEAQHREVEDIVHAYKAVSFPLDGKDYREVRVFIRPRRYQQPIAVRENLRRPIKVAETAQARMGIDVIPARSSVSAVSLRVDREDALRDYEITYDITVGSDAANRVELLDFPDALQRHGHHFSSKLTAEEFGISFTDILEAYNKKFERVAALKNM